MEGATFPECGNLTVIEAISRPKKVNTYENQVMSKIKDNELVTPQAFKTPKELLAG
jgi:hypothetical protein